MTEHSQQHSTRYAANSAGVTVEALWLHYFSVGANLNAFDIDSYLHGLYPVDQDERNLISLALNVLIDDLPRRPRAEFVHQPLPTKAAEV